MPTGREDALWDRTVRILHWSVAAAVFANLFIFEEGDDVHRWIGYSAIACVTARLLWGLRRDSGHARLRALPFHPRDFVRFFRTLFNRSAPSFDGHNPIASSIYVLIWADIFALAVTGFMMGLDRYWGEEWLEELHANISTVLKVLIVIHLAGLVFDSLKYRRHSWLAMIRGRR
jgi:cytochrome b